MDHQTISQILGNYGQFVGAIAIIVTLVYLAIQLSQTTTSIRASAYQSWVAANVGINIAMTNAHQSKMILEGNMDARRLSVDSAGGYMMLHLAMFQMGQATDYLYRTGSIDRSLWEAEMNRLALLLQAPGVRQMWDAGAKTQLAPEFVAAIENVKPSATFVDWDENRGFYSHSFTPN